MAAVAAGTVAAGVAVNQVLNGGAWNWWALAASLALATAAEGVNQWLAHRDASSPEAGKVPGGGTQNTISRAYVDGPLIQARTVRDVHFVTHQASPKPLSRLEAPDGLANLPPTTAQFVGRQDELDRLAAELSVEGPTVVAAVHGLGGIGKSTLAARYAELHADRYTPIWWITADTPSSLESGLAALAAALHPEPG